MNTERFDPAVGLLPGESSEHRLQEYLSLFFRGKWIILLSVGVLSASMAWFTVNTPPVYESYSLVLINTKNSHGSSTLTEAITGGSANKISNELGILKTRSLAEAVAREMLKNPYLDPAKKEEAPIVQEDEGVTTGKRAKSGEIAERLRQCMDFAPEKEADIIRITGRSSDPREAALLANTFAQTYQEQITDQSRSRSRSVREFMEQRLAEQRSQLDKAENAVKGFMESTGIVSLDAESNQIVQQMSQLQASRDGLDVDIESLSKKLSSLQVEFPEQESSVAKSISEANDPYIRLLQEQLAKLEVQRDVIVAQNDPAVLKQEMYKRKLDDIDEQVSALRLKLQQRSNAFIQSVLPGDKTNPQTDAFGYLRTLKQQMLESKFQLEALRSKRAALEGILTEYDRKFRLIPRQSIQFAQLQRDRLSTEKLYSLVEEKYNEAAITEKSEFGYVDIIDPATVPDGSVSPNMGKNMFLGIIMGLVIGIAAVILKDALDVRVRTPEQLLRKGYVSLSEVAPMGQELKLLGRAGGVPREVRQLDQNLWLIFNPTSFLGESFRRLRTNILHIQMDKRLQTIVVTSPDAGDGKTTVGSNLAIAFAETQRKILLIDADLRRPAVSEQFGLSRQPGLTDVLRGKVAFENAVNRDVTGGLDVLPCGSVSRHPSRVVGSQELQELLQQLKTMYDYIFLDAPPVLIVNDAAVLSGSLDGVILTVVADRTRMASLERAHKFIDSAGGSILGVVLNKFNSRKAFGSFYGGSRYGHYGAGDKYYASSPERRVRKK